MTATDTKENGIADIAEGGDSVVVTFDVEKASAAYRFTELQVINLIDGNTLALRHSCVTGQTTTGFSIILSGNTDSGNYKLRWRVEV